MTKVVAIDPGIVNTGCAIVDFDNDGRVAAMKLRKFPICNKGATYGDLVSLAREFDDNIPLEVREEMEEADVVLIEDQRAADQKMNHVMAHWLKAIPRKTLGQVVSARTKSAYARHVLGERKIVGYRENKRRSIRAVRRLFPAIELPDKQDDVADALLMCLAWNGYEISAASESNFAFSMKSTPISCMDVRTASVLSP